jgi:ankyrin repeat protein
MYAARTNRPDTLVALLLRGASVDARDHAGKTARTHAREAGYIHPEAELKAWRFISGSVANVHHRDSLGKTPMMYAPLRARTAKELLSKGADPNAKDKNGMTPLMHQCSTRLVDPELLTVLIEHGARKEARDSNGRTALLYGAGCMNVKAFFTLVRLGCKVQARDSRGRSAYDYAKQGKNRDLDFRIKEMLGIK